MARIFLGDKLALLHARGPGRRARLRSTSASLPLRLSNGSVRCAGPRRYKAQVERQAPPGGPPVPPWVEGRTATSPLRARGRPARGGRRAIAYLHAHPLRARTACVALGAADGDR